MKRFSRNGSYACVLFFAGLLAMPLSALAETQGKSATSEEERFFQEKCGECHPAERVFLVELNQEQRRHVVAKMRERWEGGAYWLSEADIERLLTYIEERTASGEVVQADKIESPKLLFRERCTGCHELDRIYEQVKKERDSSSAWLHVVTRMRAKAPEWIDEKEAQQIVDYLRVRTTPKQ